MITDPRFAPKRSDLPWLRRRRPPRARPAEPGSAGQAQDSPLHDFMSGHSTHERPAPAPPPAPRPAPSAPSRPAPSRPAAVSSSLDLDAPSAAPPAASTPSAPAPSSTSLDLGGDDRPPEPTRADTPTRRRREDVRVRPGDRLILTPDEPTVTLTALQSGIGTFTVEAAIADSVGDLRLGAVYEIDTGAQTTLQMTVQMTQGNRFAPPHSKRPVLVASHDRFERIGLDLRQVRGLRRLIVYAFSEGRRPLQWGGTLVLTTLGGGRIELPLESLQGGDIAVLLSVYRVRGELVLRAEMQALWGDVREAARAYGFGQITWLDDRTPVE